MSEWFVQHGGKQYGPLTAAKLKQSAAAGKITPATSVRLGSDGAWVPASRVNGLFATAPKSPGVGNPPSKGTGAARPAAPKTPPAPPVAKRSAGGPLDPLDDLDDLLSAPPPPLAAAPLVRAQPPKVTPLPKAVPAAGGAASSSVAAKVIGGVALVLGILALATCWLPIMGGSAVWIPIAVGTLGLAVGIAAFVMAAMHKGAGLALGIAGTSTALVGLVMTLIAWMYLTQAPAPAPKIIVTPAPAEPAPPAAPVAAEPEPEPVWTDASEAIEQGNIRARIDFARVEPVALESMDLSTLKRPKPKPMLKVRVSIENISQDKIVEAPGWPGGADLMGQGVTQLLGGEAGAAIKSATATATMADNIANKYKQTPAVQIFGAGALLGKEVSVRPGAKAEHDLVFDEPLPTIEFLRLELTPAGFGGSDSLRFQIPRAMVGGLKGP